MNRIRMLTLFLQIFLMSRLSHCERSHDSFCAGQSNGSFILRRDLRNTKCGVGLRHVNGNEESISVMIGLYKRRSPHSVGLSMSQPNPVLSVLNPHLQALSTSHRYHRYCVASEHRVCIPIAPQEPDTVIRYLRHCPSVIMRLPAELSG